MSVASSRSDRVDGLASVRVDGGVALAFEAGPGGARAIRVAEADGWRVRFPRLSKGSEAVLLNTGGGIAGGDAVALSAAVGAGASVTVTSAAAERVYRALAAPTRMTMAMQLGRGAALAWLPQETILYNGASLDRRVEVAMAHDARLTLADILVLGRRALPEVMTAGRLADRWTIRRGGRLCHAEAVRLSDDIEGTLQRGASGGGAHVVATLVHVAPDAADRLEAVRASIAGMGGVEAAAGAWNGKLVLRALGARTDRVRRLIASVAEVLTGLPCPRVWAT